MNNDLKQFSEERLKDMQKHVTAGMTLGHADALLIRQAIGIALAAKQAKPEYHIVRLELNDAWGNEAVLNAYESQLDASKCKDDHGGVIIPCYTTPQPAHTEVNSPEIPDGWKLVPVEPTEAMLISGLEEANPLGGLFDWDSSKGECNTREQLNGIFTTMLRAAPKPESE